MIEYRPGSVDHAAILAPCLRDADRAECELMGYTAEEALAHSYRHSFMSRTVFIDGEPAAALGLVAPVLGGGTAVPWLLTTPLVENHKVAFVRDSRRFVRYALDIFPHLQNSVDCRYDKALRWLAAIGFTVRAPANGFCLVEVSR